MNTFKDNPLFNRMTKYSCDLCETDCRSEQEFSVHNTTDKHLKNLCGGKLEKYTCTDCAFTTRNLNHYERHLKTQKHKYKNNYNVIRKYNCEECALSTDDKAAYYRHMKCKRHLVQIGDKSNDFYKCEACNYSTNSKSDSKRHEKSKRHNRIIDEVIIGGTLDTVTERHMALTTEEKQERTKLQLSRLAQNEHVPIINKLTKVKRYGTAAPSRRRIDEFIDSHEDWEILVYDKKQKTRKDVILDTLENLMRLLTEALSDDD